VKVIVNENFNFGAYVKKEREKNGWSQASLAADCNITQSTLSKYERGETVIPIEIVVRLLDLFGHSLQVTPNEINHGEIKWN
jgi:transcriptional regulator with XRE-family HTH domain